MENEVIKMSIRLVVVSSYVKAVNESGLRERSLTDYHNCLASKLHDIQGDKILFRYYINDFEYWEYAFKRAGKGKIEYIYTTYGADS